jgi:putative sigma-54 modulation protein
MGHLRKRLAGSEIAPGEQPTVQISVAMRHGHLAEETQEKLRQKAEKLSRFFERLTSIEIVVDLREPSRPSVGVNVSAEHKNDFVAHEQADNLLTAMETAVQKLEQQLRKYKERVVERHRDPEARRQEAPPAVADDDSEE